MMVRETFERTLSLEPEYGEDRPEIAFRRFLIGKFDPAAYGVEVDDLGNTLNAAFSFIEVIDHIREKFPDEAPRILRNIVEAIITNGRGFPPMEGTRQRHVIKEFLDERFGAGWFEANVDTALSNREIMADLHDSHPEWFEANVTQEIMAGLHDSHPEETQALPKLLADSMTVFDWDGREVDRRAHIEKVLEMDNVVLPASTDSGVDFETSFESFVLRLEFPDVQVAKQAVEAWVKGDGPPICVLTGIPGTGKTHLAEAAAVRLRGRGQELIYRHESAMINDVRRGVALNTMNSVVELFSTCIWLVIDDLGLEALSETMQGVEDQIIDARWRKAPPLRTLLTTNLTKSQLAPRIASRISDVDKAIILIINADDMRKTRKGK